MKILFILDLFKPHVWWVEILFDNVIKWLLEKWHKVTVLTSKFSPDLKNHEKIDDNYEIYRVWHNRYDFMLYSLWIGVKLARKADIIHTTTYNSAIPASIIGKISGKRVVLTVHEIFGKLRYTFMWRKWFFFKLFEDLIFKFPFDSFVCVSNYTKNNLRINYWLPDDKLITIYNGIDYDHWNKDSFSEKDINQIKQELGLKSSYTWLYFWRPWISKWLKYFIGSIPKIIQKIPNFKAILIVSESENNPADLEKQLITTLWIQKHIIWIPGVKYAQLGNYILASDFVVVPSLVEWFWFSAAETCALGQQLIVTNVASLPEVVSWKINFVWSSNSQDIADKAIDFYHWKYTTIPEKMFYWEDNIERVLGVYNNLV